MYIYIIYYYMRIYVGDGGARYAGGGGDYFHGGDPQSAAQCVMSGRPVIAKSTIVAYTSNLKCNATYKHMVSI